MPELKCLSEPPIKPIYEQTGPDVAIELGSKVIRFDDNGVLREGPANVTMRFAPRQRLEFDYILEDPSPLAGAQTFANGAEGVELTLPNGGASVDGYWSAANGNNLTFVPRTSGIVTTPHAGELSTATFHLFNFPVFHGPGDYILVSGDPPFQGGERYGAAHLQSDGWSITIAATYKTKDLAKALEASGRYVITHIGRIVRADGSTFSTQQLDSLLECLHRYLSFVLGRWAGLGFTIGTDASGNRVFEEWGLRIAADGPWSGGISWFDKYNGGLLAEMFPGFCALWSNVVWHQPSSTASIFMFGRMTVALALCSWNDPRPLSQMLRQTIVIDCNMVMSRKFKPGGLSAAAKLRLLATSLGISVQIPPACSALLSKTGTSWTDGMHAITSIRNSLVHPDSNTQIPDGAYYDGWRLSMWYLDLILLRLCGHNGVYANRLAKRCVGQVESVPWAPAATPN